MSVRYGTVYTSRIWVPLVPTLSVPVHVLFIDISPCSVDLYTWVLTLISVIQVLFHPESRSATYKHWLSHPDAHSNFCQDPECRSVLCITGGLPLFVSAICIAGGGGYCGSDESRVGIDGAEEVLRDFNLASRDSFAARFLS
jgi:hypothetical protein